MTTMITSVMTTEILPRHRRETQLLSLPNLHPFKKRPQTKDSETLMGLPPELVTITATQAPGAERFTVGNFFISPPANKYRQGRFQMPQGRIDRYFESRDYKTDLSNKYMPKELAYSTKNLRDEDLLWKLQKQNAKLDQLDSEENLDQTHSNKSNSKKSRTEKDIHLRPSDRVGLGEERLNWWGKFKNCIGCSDKFKKGDGGGASRYPGNDVVHMESKDHAGEE